MSVAVSGADPIEALTDLRVLAERINAHHGAAEAAGLGEGNARDEVLAAGRRFVEFRARRGAEALLAGQALVRVKGIVGHGGFEAWVRRHCRFDVRTARNYMALANRKVSDLPGSWLTLKRLLRWGEWFKTRVPDVQVVLGWPAEDQRRLREELDPLARLLEALPATGSVPSA